MIVVWTTLPEARSAKKLARGLVAKKLAACVSVVPGVSSTYRWKKKVETSREVLVLIKTSKARWKAVQKFVLEKHPYELPELIAIPVAGGSKAYLSWVEKMVDLSGLEPLASSLRTRRSTN